MADHYHLDPVFKPILLAGQTARLMRSHSSFVDVRVKAVGTLGVHRHDFGRLSSVITDADDTHLDMQRGELAQYRFVVRGPFEVHLQHPAGVDQFRTSGSDRATRTSAFRIGEMDPRNEPDQATAQWMLSQFYVLEDETPRFDLYPYAPTTQQIDAYVDFYGIKYSLAKLASGQQPMVEIWVNGWPIGDSLV